MALIVSLMSNGDDVGSTIIDLGDIAVGSDSTINLYVRHDYTNYISEVKYFFGEKTGNYSGDASSASEDWNELLGWATNSSGDGVFLSQDNGTTFTQLVGGSLDTSDNGAPVSNTAQTGVIQPNEESHIQIKVHVPLGEDTGGVRQFDFNVYYLYTS